MIRHHGDAPPGADATPEAAEIRRLRKKCALLQAEADLLRQLLRRHGIPYDFIPRHLADTPEAEAAEAAPEAGSAPARAAGSVINGGGLSSPEDPPPSPPGTSPVPSLSPSPSPVHPLFLQKDHAASKILPPEKPPRRTREDLRRLITALLQERGSMSANEIARVLGYRKLTDTVRTVIGELLEAGTACYRCPDKLRSKNQKLSLTGDERHH